MIYSSRTKSYELLMLTSLNSRMNLHPNDKMNLFIAKKGYEGELMVDSLLENLSCESLMLNGLLFDWNNTNFQIDKLVIFQDHILSLESKNLEGDYYIENGEWYSPHKKITNPIFQMERSKTMLQQILQYYRIPLPIKSHVIFPNPNFTLYNTPRDLPLILPTQLNQFKNQMNKLHSSITKQHGQIADRLLSKTVFKSRYTSIPPHDFKTLKKGIICESCEVHFVSLVGRTLICPSCGHREHVDAGVLRSVKELKFLFPDMPITTTVLAEWCGLGSSLRLIRRILASNFITDGRAKNRAYIEERTQNKELSK